MEYVEFENFAIDLAKSAGEEIMSFYGKIKNVKNKSSDIDLVTEADTNSENIIIESIKQKFPNHDILSEERAYTVYDYLLARGVNQMQLSFKGYGISNLGKKLKTNRRVELRVKSK